MKLQGIAVIVTGAASGLGAATVERLVAKGARVAAFDLNEDAGLPLAQRVGAAFFKADVTDEASVAAAIAAAEAAHGVARILVNCAGIVFGARTVGSNGQPHAIHQFRKVVDINLIGAFSMISRVAARLIGVDPLDEERGVIINTASVAAFDGQIGQAAYAASKAAVVGMTLPLARELAAFGIRVVTIAPGTFWTPMLASLSPAILDSLGKQTPFPSRLGKPDEFAQLAESIIGNPMLNGETIRLDGAIRMAPK